MAYDPFARGPYAVATTTLALTDTSRERAIPVAVWRPEGVAGAPLIVHSHSSYGHPRQSSFLCEHLASHGYVVAAPAHTGNTPADLRPSGAPPLASDELDSLVRRMIADRVPDLRFTLDRMLAGGAGLAIDPARVGVLGWSFGGWAALATLEQDDRPAAVVALAAAGSSRPLPGIIPATLTFRWSRVVPALFLAADRDQYIPAAAVAELYDRAPGPKWLYTLRNADHAHFADEVPPGMCDAEHAHAFTRALTLAHFDATLRGDPGAAGFRDDAVAALRARGVDAT